MRLPSLRTFSVARATLEQVVHYLVNEHSSNLSDILNSLRRISFTDNFDSFRVTVTIAAGAELGIENKLRGTIPTDRIIVRSTGHEIVDGDSAWTTDYVYLKNQGASAVTATVVFLR